eukprot:SAG31_NODE_3692_length_3982_cov_2.921473_3_plen_195_part_00
MPHPLLALLLLGALESSPRAANSSGAHQQATPTDGAGGFCGRTGYPTYCAITAACNDTDATISSVVFAGWGAAPTGSCGGFQSDPKCAATAKAKAWVQRACAGKHRYQYLILSHTISYYLILSHTISYYLILSHTISCCRSCVLDPAPGGTPVEPLGDPCYGSVKYLVVELACSHGGGSVTHCAVPPPPPSSAT